MAVNQALRWIGRIALFLVPFVMGVAGYFATMLISYKQHTLEFKTATYIEIIDKWLEMRDTMEELHNYTRTGAEGGSVQLGLNNEGLLVPISPDEAHQKYVRLRHLHKKVRSLIAKAALAVDDRELLGEMFYLNDQVQFGVMAFDPGSSLQALGYKSLKEYLEKLEMKGGIIVESMRQDLKNTARLTGKDFLYILSGLIFKDKLTLASDIERFEKTDSEERTNLISEYFKRNQPKPDTKTQAS